MPLPNGAAEACTGRFCTAFGDGRVGNFFYEKKPAINRRPVFGHAPQSHRLCAIPALREKGFPHADAHRAEFDEPIVLHPIRNLAPFPDRRRRRKELT